MGSTKVVLNTASFGRNVMAGAGVTAKVTALAEFVAAQVEGGTVETFVTPAAGGGARVHARISNGKSDSDEAESNELTIALLGTLGGRKD